MKYPTLNEILATKVLEEVKQGQQTSLFDYELSDCQKILDFYDSLSYYNRKDFLKSLSLEEWYMFENIVPTRELQKRKLIITTKVVKDYFGYNALGYSGTRASYDKAYGEDFKERQAKWLEERGRSFDDYNDIRKML